MTADFPVTLAASCLMLFAGASYMPRLRYTLGGFALACGLGFLIALAFVPGIIDAAG